MQAKSSNTLLLSDLDFSHALNLNCIEQILEFISAAKITSKSVYSLRHETYPAIQQIIFKHA